MVYPDTSKKGKYCTPPGFNISYVNEGAFKPSITTNTFIMKKLLLLTAIIAGTAFFFTASAQQGYRYGNDRDYGYGHDYHKEYFKWKKHHGRDSYEDFCRRQRYEGYWNNGYRMDQRFEGSRPGSYNNNPGNSGSGNGGYNNGGYNNSGGYNNPGGNSGYGNGSNSGSGTHGSNSGYGTQGGGRTSSHRGH